MSAYDPATLPSIDSVEVVVLHEVEVNQVHQYMESAADAPTVTLGGEEAQRVAGLWRGLPLGEQARCHIPPYGLRFRWAGRVVCEASVCWECNNLFGTANGQAIHCAFDGDHPTSRALLAALAKAAGDEQPA